MSEGQQRCPRSSSMRARSRHEPASHHVGVLASPAIALHERALAGFGGNSEVGHADPRPVGFAPHSEGTKQ